ncbi:MAG: hypothetical protein HRT58_17445 [Crocinitomicaceae bacterium]|nr:hypothetical protein [Flavobacteriales bacterium]NQZ37456.1 hypothetical protein [Crocinitomicaceae bacterium]
MEEKNDIFDHLKPRKTPIPDASYFESMAKSVIESQKAPIIPLYKRPVVWISAVAAIFIAGIMIVNFSTTSDINSDPLLALNDVSSDELYAYIDENIDDFETDLIVEALNESSVDEMNFIEPEPAEQIEVKAEKTDPESISFDEVDSKDILDYFNEEGIDSDEFEDDDSFI